MRKWNMFLVAAVVLALGLTGVAQEKIKVEKLDDLPRHTYTIEIPAVEMFDNDDALLALADKVETDLLADLEKYDIQDKTTLKGYYGDLGVVALLEGRYDDYLMYLGKIKELEDKEAARLTAGLFWQAYVHAMKTSPDDPAPAMEAKLAEIVQGLPYEVVEPNLKQIKSQAEIYSEALMAGVLQENVQPMLEESGGEMSKEIATQILSYALAAREYVPNKQVVVGVIEPYLAANKVEKPDIWADRDVVLTEQAEASPVTIAVWDSGLDPDVFGDQMWTNADEVPGNNVDDDNNGWVDDVHGIAFTLHSDKTKDILMPIDDLEGDRDVMKRQMKGVTDLQANVDSEEASEVKQKLASLERHEARPFIENIIKYGSYAHGTHVGGIAAKGNPYARLLAARITFDMKMVPETPTVEQARKDSVAMNEYIEYFKNNGVRVVNMSWGGDLSSIEKALEQNNAGGTPEERKELARKIFKIGRDGLYEAIKNAPEILFVTSAGNDDNDVNFEEVIPSNFDLPNIMTVGAVDQAGDETGFTSFGKCDVYANGYEVVSYIPGGEEMPMSGTSMSSPQVTNLVGKMLAMRPDLDPVRVRGLIIANSEEKQVGDRTVRLINPIQTIKAVQEID